MASTQTQSIELLNIRLREIEEALFGSDELAPLTKESLPNQATLVRTISEIDQKLKTLTIGKERFNHCYNELRKLERWIGAEEAGVGNSSLLSLDVANEIATDASKFEEVLAFEEDILEDAQSLEKINALEATLNKPEIRKVPELKPALESLKLDLLRTKKEALDLEDECRVAIDQTWLWFQDLAAKLAAFNVDLAALEKKNEEAKFE